MKSSNTVFLWTILISSIAYTPGFSQAVITNSISSAYHNPTLVDKFYAIQNQSTCWFSAFPLFSDIKNYFLQVLDSAVYSGLDKEKYHYSEIKTYVVSPADSVKLIKLDRIFTDGLITYYKDLNQGIDIDDWISNDEISPKFRAIEDDSLLGKLMLVKSVSGLKDMFATIEPQEKEYSLLKTELNKQTTEGSKENTDKLQVSMNLYRWVHHFHFDKFIVVNIPAAKLQYYEGNKMKGEMKVVVGKPATRSPRFATWCYQVIMYPYWNVPEEIGVKELLPQFKKKPASMDEMNMQLLDANNNIVDHHSVNWSLYDKNNFPFRFRQCTGCDNALGVIKFNLTDPFDVYLHDTNFKVAFLKDTRFLSHGCIRVEKPIELANYLLNTNIDSNFLKACYKDLKPIPTNLEKKVPVFVIYMPVDVNADSVVFYKDIYKLFK